MDEEPPAGSRRIRIALLALLIAIVGGGILGWWFSPSNAPARYRRTSLVALRRHVDRHPTDFYAWKEIGIRLARHGDALAEKPLREAFALNPADPEVATGLGEILLTSRRDPEAFQVLKAAVEHNPRFALARMALGRLYKRRGSYLHASRQFEEVVRINPQFADGWYELAICYLQMQQSKQAREAIARALTLSPREPHYLALKGSVDAAVGDIDAGIAAARQAAELAPESLRIQVNLANILVAHQRGPDDLRQAEEAISRIEALSPDYSLLPFLKGEVARLRGDWKSAVEHLERAVRTAPGQNEVLFSLSQVYRRLGRSAEAERVLAKFRERQEMHRRIDEVRIALGADPGNLELQLKLADLLAESGDIAGAASTLESALQEHPESKDAQRRLEKLRAQAQAP